MNIAIEKLKEEIKYMSENQKDMRTTADFEKKNGNGEVAHKIQMKKRDVFGPSVRAHLIAYGFLRGKTIDKIESENTMTMPNFQLVEEIISKFVGKSFQESVALRTEEIYGRQLINSTKPPKVSISTA